MASSAPVSDGLGIVAGLYWDYGCWLQSADGLQPQSSDGEEQKEPELRLSPMSRVDLAGPGPLVTSLAAAVIQWRLSGHLAHAGVCAVFLCNVLSE